MVVFEGGMTVENLTQFIESHMLPAVIEINDENAEKVFNNRIHLKLMVIMNKAQIYFEHHLNIVHEIGLNYRGRVSFFYYQAA